MRDKNHFATTRWSLVVSAQSPGDPQTRAALAELCEIYWYPLYAFLRQQGASEEEALDLVQGFLTGLLEKNDLAAAAERGRFRSYLIRALRNYAANQRRHDRAERRGGGYAIVSLTPDEAEARYRREPADPCTPEKLFERRWALTVLERALEQLRAESHARGRGEIFDALQPSLTEASNAPNHAATAARLGLTDGAVKVVLHRLRKRMGELIRSEVAQTLAEPGALEDEILGLLAALEPPGSMSDSRGFL